MIKKIIFTDRSDSLLNAYLRDISKYKILEYSEINELIKKARAGDINARNRVLVSNLRFVVTIAKQFQNRGVPLMDLIEAGNLGLARAIDKFDPERGVLFLSYAVWWIKQFIFNAIYWNGREIRLPLSQQLIVNSLAEASEKFVVENCRYPSSLELSELTNIPVKQIDFLSQYIVNKIVSIDDFVGGDEDNYQVCDIIPDGEESLDDMLNKACVKDELERMLDKLPIRDHDLLKMLYGIGIPKVGKDTIYTMFGVGVERIRQMKEAALNKMRKKFGNKLKALL